jgi:Tol biopolymer transport system component
MIRKFCRAIVLIATWACAALCSGQQVVADLQEGTNISLALSPDGNTVVIDLLGQLWSLPISGGAAAPLTPENEVVRNPRFSPDGTRLVYQRAADGQWDIWLLDLDTEQTRQLTGAPYDDREPEFSADGQSVVFASNRAGSFDIWEYQLDFGRLAQLSRSPGDASSPTVSDTGAVVYANGNGENWSLEVLDADGTNSVVYRSDNPLRAPSWRPGGGVLLFTEQLREAENNLRMLVMSEDPVVKTLTAGEDVFAFRPAWLSPAEYLYTADGRIWRRTIASVDRSPILFFAGVGLSRAEHVVRLSGHAPTGTQPARGIRAPSLSPGGAYRVFTAVGDLWLQSETGESKRLTDDAYLEIDPTFSPNETEIVFASDRSGEMELWRADLEGGGLRQLTNREGKAFNPSISPNGNQIAFLSSDGFGPWSESELIVAPFSANASERRFADGLIDARVPRWSSDSRRVELFASRRDPGTGDTVAGTLHVDVISGATRWELGDREAGLEDAAAEREAFAAPSIEWTPTEPVHHYVVQVDRLFDGVGTDYRRHMDIHVRDGRIVDVVARGLSPLPAIVIDARDLTIIPGLIDIHAHQSGLSGERLGRIWLGYGVTTVREVDSERGDALERREAWASGRRHGPRLLLTAASPPTIDQNQRFYDVVELNANRYPGAPEVAAAAALGIPIFSDRLLPAARFGINGLEHIGGRSQRPFGLERSLLDRTYHDVTRILSMTRTAVAPTLAAFGGFSRLAATGSEWSNDAAFSDFYHDYERDAWLKPTDSPERLLNLQRTVADLVRSGGRVAAGSDAPFVPYGLGLHAELALLSDAGLANDQVLRLATANAALALGLERELGTIEVGKRADFVVLRGDPLTRIADTLQIEATVKAGEWLTRESLLEAP